MKSGYRVRVRSIFEASHQLLWYQGASEPIHNHRWKVEVEAQTLNLNSEGLSLDFVEIQKALQEITKPLDHQHLNQVFPFLKKAPSAENVAKWIFDQMKEKILKLGGSLLEVRVWEGENGCASYFEAEST